MPGYLRRYEPRRIRSYDVIVYREGSKAVAITAEGDVIAKSTEHALVLNEAIKYLEYGGSIKLLVGEYILEDTVVIDRHGVEIVGSTQWLGTASLTNPKTIVKLGDGVNKDMFQITAHKVLISNLFLYGNSENNSSGRGIYVEGVDLDPTLEKLYVMKTPSAGVHIKANHARLDKVYVEYTPNNVPGIVVEGNYSQIISCLTAMTHSDAIVVNGFANILVGNVLKVGQWRGIRVSGYGNIVMANYIRQSSFEAIYLDGAEKTHVIGNILESNAYYEDDAYSVIRLVNSYRNLILGNTIYSLQTNLPHAGVYEESGDENEIMHNIIRDVHVGIIKTGPNTRLCCNSGYRTENGGIYTLTGDGTTTTFTVKIPHGLAVDSVVATAISDHDASIRIKLIDDDGDGFKETLQLTIVFDVAPASGEEVKIYWRAWAV